MHQGFKSVLKKTSTIIKNGSAGLEAISEGIRNYNYRNKEIEKLALERAETCLNCELLIEEPIELLKVEDTIPEIDQMICNDCGCSAPYKVRQNIIKCKKWKK